MNRADRSAWRLALLPAIALALAASSCAVAVDARARSTARHRSQSAQTAAFADVRRILQADLDLQLALMASWNVAMGHPVDAAEPVERARAAVDEARRSAALADGLQPIADKLAAVSGMGDDRGRLGALRDAHNALLQVLLKSEQRAGDRAGALHDGVGRLLATDDRFTFVTSWRSLAGIDPRPVAPDMQFYVAGLVAGTTNAAATPTFTSLLTSGISSPRLSDGFKALAASPAVAALAADFAWASTDPAPATTPAPAAQHPGFEELEAARKATVFGITRLLMDEIAGQTDRLDTESQASVRRSTRSTAWALGSSAAGVLALAWLLARLRRSMATLHRAAETDPLTGALNRLGLRHRVEPWFVGRSAGPVAVAVVDLDHFKAINDTYGHEAGDEVLRTVASRLTTATVEDHTAVARWGGEEYVVVFRFPDGLAEGSIDRITTRLVGRLAEPTPVADTVVQATATIGIATCRCGSCDLEDLFRVADHALYAGKFEGRNRAANVDCGFDLREHLRAGIEQPDVDHADVDQAGLDHAGPERSPSH